MWRSAPPPPPSGRREPGGRAAEEPGGRAAEEPGGRAAEERGGRAAEASESRARPAPSRSQPAAVSAAMAEPADRSVGQTGETLSAQGCGRSDTASCTVYSRTYSMYLHCFFFICRWTIQRQMDEFRIEKVNNQIDRALKLTRHLLDTIFGQL